MRYEQKYQFPYAVSMLKQLLEAFVKEYQSGDNTNAPNICQIQYELKMLQGIKPTWPGDEDVFLKLVKIVKDEPPEKTYECWKCDSTVLEKDCYTTSGIKKGVPFMKLWCRTCYETEFPI
jgi:hypothetical protein